MHGSCRCISTEAENNNGIMHIMYLCYVGIFIRLKMKGKNRLYKTGLISPLKALFELVLLLRGAFCCTFHEALGALLLLVLLPAFVAPGVGGAAVMVVVLIGGFWLSVKGSSMLSIVQECRGGLLSRHRA